MIAGAAFCVHSGGVDGADLYDQPPPVLAAEVDSFMADLTTGLVVSMLTVWDRGLNSAMAILVTF